MRQININGPDGNAFALIGQVKRLGRQLGFDKPEIARITTEMMAGDYDNLCRVFTNNFGHVVQLVSDDMDERDDYDIVYDSPEY